LKKKEKQQGNHYRQEFEKLFLKHFPALFTHGFHLSGNRELTKDLIQSLFLELWEKQIPLDSIEHWNAYLKKSLYRKIVRELKQNKLISSDLDASLALPPEPSYEELLINFQTESFRKRKVRQALSTLPPIEKEMLEARFQLGMSYEEIAEQTKKSKQTVYNQIYTALKKLRKAVLFSFTFLL